MSLGLSMKAKQWLTRVESNADFDFDAGHVYHFERANAGQDVQRHVGHLGCVPVAVAAGNS